MTKLGQKEEAEFQDWIRQTPWYPEYKLKYREEPDLNTSVYDYRGAWKAGAVPQKNPNDNMYHWPSKFKSEEHPTFWKEIFMRKFRIDPDSIGVTKEQAFNLIDKKIGY